MKILICPLNWGLGHATRCVPIIQKLMNQGHELVIAADGYPVQFLRQQFPTLKTIEFPGYKINYASGKSQILAMVKNMPNIISGIIKEHKSLKKLLKQNKFDQIISDNRFGLWNKKVHSIYITHQLMIKMPDSLNFLEPIAWFIHRYIIQRYDECWIPDFEGIDNLSGDLSHKYPLLPHAKFIGMLSRFQHINEIIPSEDFDIVAVISGVEPQRTVFENQLLNRFADSEQKILIVCGKPALEKTTKQVGNITCISHLNDNELAAILLGAKKIISRSGYSTIMDLKSLNCLYKAEFIPTPGQTEQEYLFKIHSQFN